MVTGVAGKHTKIEKTTASRESGFQLSRYLLWNVYIKRVTLSYYKVMGDYHSVSDIDLAVYDGNITELIEYIKKNGNFFVKKFKDA